MVLDSSWDQQKHVEASSSTMAWFRKFPSSFLATCEKSPSSAFYRKKKNTDVDYFESYIIPEATVSMNGPRNSAFSRVTLLFLMSKARNINIAVMAILSRSDTLLLTNYLIILSALNALNLKTAFNRNKISLPPLLVMRVANARDTWHEKRGYESGYEKKSYFLRAHIITFILEWFSLDCQKKFALVFRCHVKPFA